MLASRVHLIAEYVKAILNGDVPFNHEIVREINALANRLPVLNSNKFREEFFNVSLYTIANIDLQNINSNLFLANQ